MKTHYLKITALTPLHIGTGEDYEPTNFIVEDGALYEFDETDFYHRLSPIEKTEFNSVVSRNTPDMLFQVHAFVKRHKEKAIESARNRVPVSKGIEEDYRKKIGKVVQMEGKGGRHADTKKVFNQFQIARSQRLHNTNELYLPGSSFKGALSTAWQEWLYKHDRDRWEKEFKELRNPPFSPMKNLLVADT
jgi:CRISPR-associated protein Csm5